MTGSPSTNLSPKTPHICWLDLQENPKQQVEVKQVGNQKGLFTFKMPWNDKTIEIVITDYALGTSKKGMVGNYTVTDPKHPDKPVTSSVVFLSEKKKNGDVYFVGKPRGDLCRLNWYVTFPAEFSKNFK